MDPEFSKNFNLIYSHISCNFNNTIKNKVNNKLFISKACLICIEEKQQMILFNDCNHSVICVECYNILLNYHKVLIEKNDNDINDENNNLLKCPYCNELVSNKPNNIEYL